MEAARISDRPLFLAEESYFFFFFSQPRIYSHGSKKQNVLPLSGIHSRGKKNSQDSREEIVNTRCVNCGTRQRALDVVVD